MQWLRIVYVKVTIWSWLLWRLRLTTPSTSRGSTYATKSQNISIARDMATVLLIGTLAPVMAQTPPIAPPILRVAGIRFAVAHSSKLHGQGHTRHSRQSSSKRVPVASQWTGVSSNPKQPASRACVHTTVPDLAGVIWALTHEHCARSYGSCIHSSGKLVSILCTCSWDTRMGAFWLTLRSHVSIGGWRHGSRGQRR